MVKFGESSDMVKCSFCGKSQQQVGKLIAGPGVYICNECIEICYDIIDDEVVLTSEGDVTFPGAKNGPSSDEETRVFDGSGRLTSQLGRPPTVAGLAAELGLDQEKITELLRRASRMQPEAGASAWRVDSPLRASVQVTLRTIQQQMHELAEQLSGLVEQVERQDDP